MLNSECKACYRTWNGPLKKFKSHPSPPQALLVKVLWESIMSRFNSLFLLISLCDMFQGIRSFPIVYSALIYSHVAMRTERSALLSGTFRREKILCWGSTAILNKSLRGENTAWGLILNMLLNEPKSNILGVLCNEGGEVFFSWRKVIAFITSAVTAGKTRQAFGLNLIIT